VTLKVIHGSPIAIPFKRDFSCSSAAVDKISTDIQRVTRSPLAELLVQPTVVTVRLILWVVCVCVCVCVSVMLWLKRLSGSIWFVVCGLPQRTTNKPARHRDVAGGIIYILLVLLSFFKCRPSQPTTGGQIAMRTVALTLSIKRLLRLNIW